MCSLQEWIFMNKRYIEMEMNIRSSSVGKVQNHV